MCVGRTPTESTKTYQHCKLYRYAKFFKVYLPREERYSVTLAEHASLLGGAQHAEKVVEVCHAVLGMLGV